MNTRPDAITVLCYEDSNTHGQKPDRTGRYIADERWTGRLQTALGDNYYIIEEGLGSRSTDLDYAKKPGRNGKTYLMPYLASHGPLDIVIIMLGTNDLKIEYSRHAADIANALQGLVADVRQDAEWSKRSAPNIILISPILINDKAERFAELYTGYYDNRSAAISAELANTIQSMAEANSCIFLNAAEVANPGEDGIHLDSASNQPLSELIASAVQRLRTND